MSSKSADEIDHIVKESVDKATEKAVDNGADPKSIKIVEKSIIPKVGVHAKVVGVLKEDYEDKDDPVNKPTVLSDESLPKPTDNPNWPYQSATDAEEDKKYGLPDPIISKKYILNILCCTLIPPQINKILDLILETRFFGTMVQLN